jgi:hypothetical protein
MTEVEAHAIMKAQGWSYQKRIRHKRRIPYVYAKRRQGKNFTERYICPLSKLGELTEQELLIKLAPKSTPKL